MGPLQNTHQFHPIGVLILNNDLTIQHLDQHFSELFQCQPADIEGKPLDHIFYPRDRKGQNRFHEKLNGYTEGLEEALVFLTILNKDYFSRIRFAQHENKWFFYVEPLKRNQDLLYKNYEGRERWRHVVRCSSDGIAILDNINKIIEYNQRFLDYLDFRSSHGALLSDKVIRNKNLFDLVNRAKFRPFEAFLQQAKGAKKGSFNESINYKNRDLIVTVTAINFPLEGFIGSSLTLRDVTADVQMEGLRKKTALKLKQAKETAEDIAQAKSDFLSTAAHELRTPLTSIQGFSEILLTRDQLSDTVRKKYLGYINKQAKGLGQIINDLLDISRIESGRNLFLKKAEVSMNEFLDRLLEVFGQRSPLLSECHQFTLELPEKSPLLSIDAEKMSSVMKNLVSNAVKYSPDGGTIEVAGVVSGAVYQVSISDQGLGMTPEQVERIFEKFYRVDASNTSTEGTGLGMTIAKNIVEAHGGDIWVESELGQGTTVRFSIPMD